MSWLHFVLAFLLGGVFLLGPGYAFLAAARVSAWFRLTLAPLVSAAWVAGLGIVFGWTGIRFEGWTVLGATVVGALIVAALMRLTPVGPWLAYRRRGVVGDRDDADADDEDEHADPGTPWSTWLALAAGLVVSLAVWLEQFLRPLSGPAAVSRAYDTPWHASIVKQFMVSGNGSTLTAANVDHTVGSSFYPAAWHDMVALVAGLGHAPVFGGINAVVLGELTLVWPLAMAAFVSVLFGRRPAPVFAAAILGCLFAAFPLTFLVWGILYSNLYGYVLLPGLLALCLMLFEGRIPAGLGRRLVAVLFVIGLIGDAIAQPNTAFTLVVLMLPMVLGTLYRWVAARRSRALAWAACVALTVVGALAWVGLAHTKTLHRTTTLDRVTASGVGEAVKGALFQGFSNGRHQWALAALVILGALVLLLFQRRRQWLVVSHVLICLCYVVSASRQVETHLHWLRMNLTGYWYNDFTRLAAAAILTAVPLAVAGVEGIVALVARLRMPVLVRAVAAVVILALLTLGTMRSTQFHDHRVQLQTMARHNSELYGPRLAFLKRAASIVPPGQVVANNPFDGSVYGWSLYGLDTFYKSYSRNWIGHPSAAMVAIADHLDQAAHDHKLCFYLKKYDVTYALKMSTKGRLVDFHWKGQHLTPHTPGFKLVASGPGARLYRITACGLGSR